MGLNMTYLIPKCLLTSLVKQRAGKHTSTNFQYISQCGSFLEKVKRDISAIHVLFPQFTPHDDLYHLEPLFKLASNLLGEQLLKRLNITELFLLACALYGHDWGMAVDERYKQKLMSRTPEVDKNIEEDAKRLRSFLAEIGDGVVRDGAIHDLDMN